MSKHIVIDARSRPSSTGRYVDRLLQHLQTLDTENTYTVLLRPKDEWQSTAKNFSTAVCPYKQFSFNPLDQIKFARFLKDLRPDLVHFAMTPQEPLLYFGSRITTTHDLTMLRYTRAGKLPIVLHWVRMAGYRMLFWSAHRKAKHVIVPTKFVADDLRARYGFTADKTVVTYESSEPPLDVEAEPVSSATKPFIMHVGSPFPHKNLEHLIEAFEIVLQHKPELQLVLAGKREYYFEQLEDWARERQSYKNILFTGFVSDAELKWLYQSAECYALPSLSEGFGLPGLEAMAHGCPVVSSDATCLPEVYGDAAHYFDPTNVQDMARAIEDVINSESLQKHLRSAGKKQLQKYSWSKMAKETLKIYNET